MWGDSSPKIKHETIRMNFQAGGLENLEVRFKFVSLQCSWIRKLYDGWVHEWKIIPSQLLVKYFGFPLNSIQTFILKVKFQKTFQPFTNKC